MDPGFANCVENSVQAVIERTCVDAREFLIVKIRLQLQRGE